MKNSVTHNQSQISILSFGTFFSFLRKHIFLFVTVLGTGLLLVGQSGNGFAQEADTTMNQDPPAEDNEPLYDEIAQFPGGMDSLYKWLATNVEYPDVYKEEQKEGVVNIQFAVGEDGVPSEFVIVGPHLSPKYDHAALKAVRKLPNWIPAKKDGVPVKSYFILPIRFSKLK